MVVMGSLATILTLALGAVVVRAALSNADEPAGRADRAEAARESNAAAGGGQRNLQNEIQAGTATSPGNPAPPLDSGEAFRISCLAGNSTDTQNTCQVESFSGFAGRVDLSCADLPSNLSCTLTPSSVFPRPNGSTTFRLELSAGDVAPGSYVFDVVGRSGNQVRTYRYPWGLTAPRVAVAPPAVNPPPGASPAPAAAQSSAAGPEPTFRFTCGSLTEGSKLEWSLAKDGPRAKIKCFLTPLDGFNEPVTFTYSETGNLAKPETVAFAPVDQLDPRKPFDLNFELSDAVKDLPPEQLKAGRDYTFNVTGTSASGKKMTLPVTLTVKE